MKTRPRSVAFIGIAGLAVAGLGASLQSASREQPPSSSQATCDGTRNTISFSVSSSRELGWSSTPIPTGARHIEVVVTIPANLSQGAKDCGLGDESVNVGTCPAKGGRAKEDCVGIGFTADSGTGLSKCHQLDQTLGPYDWPIQEGDGLTIEFSAVTVHVAKANIELTCKR